MFTITTRLTLGYLLSFGSIMVAIAILMYAAFAQNERAALDAELEDYASFLISEADTASTSISELYDKLQDVTAQANLRFRSMRIMLTTKDSLVYESSPSLEPLVDSVQNVLLTRSGERFHNLSLEESDYRIFIRPITGRSADELGMVVVAPLTRLQQTLAGLRNLLLVIVPASVVLASVGGWYTARKALEPVSKIRATAAAISSSNLHERVPTGSTSDELSELASTFNQMIARLELTFAAQRRFVADASHDLRTPLMVIQAKLDRLLAIADLPPHVREDLRHCASEVDRLTRLANDLLLLARAESNQLKLAHVPERLDEMLIECVAKMKALASRKNVSLWVDVDDAVELACDPPTLQRVLMNILDNAIMHTPEGGTVTTRLVLRDTTAAVITIADTGPGIPPEDLPRIFDRFYRSDTPRSTPGSGLGLAIAKTIIEAHHGTIAVESAQGEGTTVRIEIPVGEV